MDDRGLRANMVTIRISPQFLSTEQAALPSVLGTILPSVHTPYYYDDLFLFT